MSLQLGKILVIDDNEDILSAARLLLKEYATQVITAKEPHSIPSLLKDENFDIVLLDMNFSRGVTSGAEGFDWLRKIKEIDPTVIVLLITAYGDIELAVKAIKAGATDFIQKPWQNEKMLTTLASAMKLRSSQQELDKLRSREKQLAADIDQRYHEMIGECEGMQRVFHTIDKVAKTDANVLILGENGTGKELVARAIHRESSRAHEVFISVDMGAISETLFESELFGHVKGAFTDARNDRTGRFEIASGGTLFLDEIGNLSAGNQAKLLRVLEERQIMPIGSNKQHSIDIRLICATNMPVYEMVKNGEFRQDFLYRINTVEVLIPPLRERMSDIPLLLDHFLAIYSKKYNRTVPHIPAPTLSKLQNYTWPGNIRELRHSIERTLILHDQNTLQPEDFSLGKNQSETSFDSFNLDSVEKDIILKVLEKYAGNKSHAANELGLTRTSLYRRMQKHGLQ